MTIYTANPPLVNDLLSIGPIPVTSSRVTVVSGSSSPYTVTVLPGLAIDQPNGATVVALPTIDVYLNGAQNPTPASALTWGVRYYYGGSSPAIGDVIPFFRGIGGLQTDRFGLGVLGSPNAAPSAWQVATVAAVHTGTPTTVDLVGSTAGVPCIIEYTPTVGDLALIGVGIGPVPGNPGWAATNKAAIGTFGQISTASATMSASFSLSAAGSATALIGPGLAAVSCTTSGTMAVVTAFYDGPAFYQDDLTRQQIATGPDGNLWICDQYDKAVIQCSTTGVFSSFAAPIGTGIGSGAQVTPFAISPDPTGTELWMLGGVYGVGVELFTVTTAGVIAPFATPVTFHYTTLTSGDIVSMCVGPDGNMWFLQANGVHLYFSKVTPAGVETTYTQTTTLSVTCQGICVGGDGNLWGMDQGSLYKCTPTGTITLEFTSASSTDHLGGLCLGSDGNVWFTYYHSASNTSEIVRITPSGATTNFPWTSAFAAYSTNYCGIITGPDGNIWGPLAGTGTDYSGGVVQQMNISTQALTQFSIPPLPSEATGDNGPGLLGVCIGPDGNIWFTGGPYVSFS
jgi:streptogramin lyase